MCKALLAVGAWRDVRDESGRTSLQAAFDRSCVGVVRHLQSLGERLHKYGQLKVDRTAEGRATMRAVLRVCVPLVMSMISICFDLFVLSFSKVFPVALAVANVVARRAHFALGKNFAHQKHMQKIHIQGCHWAASLRTACGAVPGW